MSDSVVGCYKTNQNLSCAFECYLSCCWTSRLTIGRQLHASTATPIKCSVSEVKEEGGQSVDQVIFKLEL